MFTWNRRGAFRILSHGSQRFTISSSIWRAAADSSNSELSLMLRNHHKLLQASIPFPVIVSEMTRNLIQYLKAAIKISSDNFQYFAAIGRVVIPYMRSIHELDSRIFCTLLGRISVQFLGVWILTKKV